MYLWLMDLYTALIGAVVGSVLTFVASLIVARNQRNSRERAQAYELQRTLTVALVQSMLAFWECKQNPSANAHRYREVESRMEADIAMFNANLEGYRACCVRWYVSMAVMSIRVSRPQWSKTGAVREAICEPLLKWAGLDSSYGNSWFAARSSLGVDDFTPENILRKRY